MELLGRMEVADAVAKETMRVLVPVGAAYRLMHSTIVYDGCQVSSDGIHDVVGWFYHLIHGNCYYQVSFFASPDPGWRACPGQLRAVTPQRQASWGWWWYYGW